MFSNTYLVEAAAAWVVFIPCLEVAVILWRPCLAEADLVGMDVVDEDKAKTPFIH